MAVRQHSRNRWVERLILGALTYGLFACGADQAKNPPNPTPSNPTPTLGAEPSLEPTPSATPSPAPVELPQVAVYWLQNKAEKIAFAPPAKLQLSEPSTPPAEQLRTAVERLLQGPANADVFTTIPEGTKLNALSVKPDGVHVDLTKQFAEGGGSASMQGRLGQLIYTASSHDPKQSVWISIDGEPLTVLGGEGLEVSQPMTRQEFEAEFSL